jgi:hypothetical protein
MYTLYYISNLTVVEELVERVNNVFAERLKLETPFVSASTAYIRGFLFKDIWVSLTVERHRSNERGTTPKATETILISEKMETSVQIRNPYLIKISGSNRFYPDCLQRSIENEYQKNRLCDRLSNLDLDTRVKQRDQGLFSSCELISITKRLIVGEGNMSTLIRYMRMILLGSRGKAVLPLKLRRHHESI